MTIGQELAETARKINATGDKLAKALGQKPVDYTADTPDEKQFWEAIRFMVEEAGFREEPWGEGDPGLADGTQSGMGVVCNKSGFTIDVSIFNDDPPEEKRMTAQGVSFLAKTLGYPNDQGLVTVEILEAEQQPEPAW